MLLDHVSLVGDFDRQARRPYQLSAQVGIIQPFVLTDWAERKPLEAYAIRNKSLPMDIINITMFVSLSVPSG